MFEKSGRSKQGQFAGWGSAHEQAIASITEDVALQVSAFLFEIPTESELRLRSSRSYMMFTSVSE